MVKVLDGRTLNDKFWVFYGALSDVEYWITVTDTVTGARKRYHNRPGNICGQGGHRRLLTGLRPGYPKTAGLWYLPPDRLPVRGRPVPSRSDRCVAGRDESWSVT